MIALELEAGRRQRRIALVFALASGKQSGRQRVVLRIRGDIDKYPGDP